MKTIAKLDGPAFLRRCNKIRHEAYALVKDTGVMRIRERMPEFTGKETKEEREAMLNEQAKKNVSDMLDALLDEHAEQTVEVLKIMCVPEDGEDINAMDGIDIATAGLEIISAPKVMDFFVSLVRSGLITTGG